VGASAASSPTHLWALGTAARPEAALELHPRQIEFEFGLIHLSPPDREQVPRKYGPTVRLPDALWEEFEGWAVAYEGEPVKSIKTGLWRACDRGGVKRCAPYSFRPTAPGMRRKRCSAQVPPWEVAAQLGHSVGKRLRDHRALRVLQSRLPFRGCSGARRTDKAGRRQASYRPVRRKK
jgi:hypothetical protein